MRLELSIGHPSTGVLARALITLPDILTSARDSSANAPMSLTTQRLYVLIDYDDPYVRSLILHGLQQLPSDMYSTITSMNELPSRDAMFLQFSSYETISFEHLIGHPASALANAYMIRKGLIRKHYLSITAKHWLSKHPESRLQEHLLPTLELELDYAEFLEEALLEAYELQEVFLRNDGKSSAEREWWILKPGMSDGGQGIRLFSSENELKEIFEQWEGLTSGSSEHTEVPEVKDDATNIVSPQRGTAPFHDYEPTITSQLRHFVVQPYIQAPLLLSSNMFKFHIRTYIVAAGGLRVYVYKKMLALFASIPYTRPGMSSMDLRVHLTNTCLQNGERVGSVQSFWDLPETAGELGRKWKEDVFGQICATTGEIFEAAARGMMVHFQTIPNAFEIFGLDFLVDENGTAWLLEINAFPDFKQTGENLKGIVEDLFEDVFAAVVAPFFGLTAPSSQAGSNDLTKVLDIDLGRR